MKNDFFEKNHLVDDDAFFSDVNICFLCTNHQKNIFFSVLDTLNLDIKRFVYIIKGEVSLPDELQTYKIVAKDRKYSFFEARTLIQEVRKLIKTLTKNENYNIWLANSDSPIGQLLINHQSRKEIFLFEDGIGSYIKTVVFDWDRSLKVTLARCRNILYLFPFYRAFSIFCSYMQPTQSFSLFNHAFPRLSDQYKTLIDHKKYSAQVKRNKLGDASFLLEENDLIFLEQSVMIEDSILSESEYFNIVGELITKVLAKKTQTKRIVLKKHPRTNRLLYEKFYLFIKHAVPDGIKLVALDNQTSFEELMCYDVPRSISIVSLSSSGLYTIKLIHNDIDLYFGYSLLMQKKFPTNKKYRDALSLMGLEEILLK